jgi:hypothetical protein
VWSASHPGRALDPGKGPPVPIIQEAGWDPEPVWIQRAEEKSIAPAGDRTPIARSSSPQSDTILPKLTRLLNIKLQETLIACSLYGCWNLSLRDAGCWGVCLDQYNATPPDTILIHPRKLSSLIPTAVRTWNLTQYIHFKCFSLPCVSTITDYLHVRKSVTFKTHVMTLDIMV